MKGIRPARVRVVEDIVDCLTEGNVDRLEDSADHPVEDSCDRLEDNVSAEDSADRCGRFPASSALAADRAAPSALERIDRCFESDLLRATLQLRGLYIHIDCRDSDDRLAIADRRFRLVVQACERRWLDRAGHSRR